MAESSCTGLPLPRVCDACGFRHHPVKDSNYDLTAHEKARIFLSTRLSAAGAMQPVLLAEQLLEALAESNLEVVHRAG